MLTDRDYELLSDYLDGALTESERADLEKRLNTEAELRRELEALRGTVALVKSLPVLPAPRDFTLTASMVRRPTQRRFLFSATFYSAVSAAAAVLLIGFGLLFLTQNQAVVPAVELQQAQSEQNGIALVPSPTLELKSSDGSELALTATEQIAPILPSQPLASLDEEAQQAQQQAQPAQADAIDETSIAAEENTPVPEINQSFAAIQPETETSTGSNGGEAVPAPAQVAPSLPEGGSANAGSEPAAPGGSIIEGSAPIEPDTSTVGMVPTLNPPADQVAAASAPYDTDTNMPTTGGDLAAQSGQFALAATNTEVSARAASPSPIATMTPTLTDRPSPSDTLTAVLPTATLVPPSPIPTTLPPVLQAPQPASNNTGVVIIIVGIALLVISLIFFLRGRNR